MKPAAQFELEVRTIRVVADRSAGVILGTGVPVPDPKRLLYLANKANKSDRTRMRQGSDEWQRIRDFELAIRAAGFQVLGQQDAALPQWDIDARRYHVAILLEFGDRTLTIPATPGRPRHTRRQTAASRAKCHDVDSVKSVLDALQGVLFANDNQVVTLHLEKAARVDGLEGDRVTIDCWYRVVSPILEVDGRQTDKHAKRGASRAAASSASRPSPRAKGST